MAVGGGYTKLSSTLTRSSVWVDPETGDLRPPEVRLAWVVLLSLAGSGGWVVEPIPVLASLVGVTTERMQEIVAMFEAPDPHSTDSANDGRRVERGIDPFGNRGLRLLSYPKYRAARDAEARRAYKRDWQREQRAAQSDQIEAAAVRSGLREKPAPKSLRLKREKQAPLVEIQTAEEPPAWSTWLLETLARLFNSVPEAFRKDLPTFKPLFDKHTIDDVQPALEAYVKHLAERNEAHYFSAQHFVGRFAHWQQQAAGGAKPQPSEADLEAQRLWNAGRKK